MKAVKNHIEESAKVLVDAVKPATHVSFVRIPSTALLEIFLQKGAFNITIYEAF